MNALTDPTTLRDGTGVEYRHETSEDDEETFDYFASIAGMVAVGVVDGDGAVLLMDGPHGWRLPYAPVDPGEDWVAVAKRVAGELTDRAVAVDRVERATAIEHRSGDGRKTVSHDVVMRTAPVDGRQVADDPGFDPWGDLEVAWFEAVPEDAYWDHGDAVDDVRRMLD